MKDRTDFVWRVLRAFHATRNRNQLIAEYGGILAQCQGDVPHLQSQAFVKVGEGT